jgi:sugar phosphate permease
MDVGARATTRMLSFAWLLFAVLALAYAFVYFHRNALSVVADDLVRDFHTSAGVTGLLSSIYFYCYAAMQFPAGLLSDSVGPRRTVTVSLLLAAAGSLLFGLAPTLRWAMLARGLVGVGVSMVFIPTMKILAQWFRAREFAFMSGLMQAAGGVGILGATWLLGPLATYAGWRFSFVLIGLCTLGIVAAAWFIVRDRPADLGWPSPVELDARQAGAGATHPPIRLAQGIRRVLAERHFWPVALWFFFDCGIFFGLGSLWGGPYLMHTYGMTRSQAGAVLGIIAWGMVLGGPLLGVLSQRVLRSRKKTFMLCTATLTLLLAVAVLWPAGLPRPVLVAWFFLFSISSSAIVIMGFTTTKELFPVEMAGTSVGMVNFFPFFGGAVFQPVLGRVLDIYPKSDAGQYPVMAYRLLLLVLLLASLAALACTFLMKETYRK